MYSSACHKGDDDDYKCMQFSCIDPNAPCANDDGITVDMFDNCGYISGIGDGWCDSYNNKEECGESHEQPEYVMTRSSRGKEKTFSPSSSVKK